MGRENSTRWTPTVALNWYRSNSRKTQHMLLLLFHLSVVREAIQPESKQQCHISIYIYICICKYIYICKYPLQGRNGDQSRILAGLVVANMTPLTWRVNIAFKNKINIQMIPHKWYGDILSSSVLGFFCCTWQMLFFIGIPSVWEAPGWFHRLENVTRASCDDEAKSG